MYLGCSDCRQKFDSLENLNKHIAKSGHEQGMTISPIAAIKMIIKKIHFAGVSITISELEKYQRTLEKSTSK